MQCLQLKDDATACLIYFGTKQARARLDDARRENRELSAALADGKSPGRSQSEAGVAPVHGLRNPSSVRVDSEIGTLSASHTYSARRRKLPAFMLPAVDESAFRRALFVLAQHCIHALCSRCPCAEKREWA